MVCADSLHKLLLVLLTLLVYSNSLGGDFVHDDVAAIVNNRDVTGGSWAALWTNDFWGLHIRDMRSHKSYRPLTVLTFRYLHTICTLSMQHLHTIYTLSSHYLHIIFTLSTHYLRNIYTLSTHYLPSNLTSRSAAGRRSSGPF